jgi:predicted transcriptional regulator YdeE
VGVIRPTLTTLEDAKFVGLRTLIRRPDDTDNDLRPIPALWQQLNALLPTIESRIGFERYAMITGDLPVDRQPEAYYYALVRVHNFSSTLRTPAVALDLSGQRIVKFRHRGPPSTIAVTAIQALQIWLPQSGETIAENSEFFIYPAEYDRSNPDAEFDYALFVK